MACKNPETAFKVCDINQALIDKWNCDDLPFFEPQLDAYFHKAKYEYRNIEFSSDVARCIVGADVIFISVNTPSKSQISGPASSQVSASLEIGIATDMRAFFSVVDQIGCLFDPDSSHKVIIEKSTVPLGTGRKVREHLSHAVTTRLSSQFQIDEHYTIVNMPEFLAEGSAI